MGLGPVHVVGADVMGGDIAAWRVPRRIEKLPLAVEDAPGLLVNAVPAPQMNEAMGRVDDGIAAETIDAAMVAFGMPMGPIELADAGVIFDTGFAPDTGGSMAYLA